MPPAAPTTSKPSLPAGYDAAPATKQSSADEQHEQHTEQDDPKGHLTLEEVLAFYDDAKKYSSNGLRKWWDKYFRVYKGQRVLRNYEGIADPVIREAHTIIETLVANIAGGNPKFHFVQTNEEQSSDTEILNEMLDYYMICNQMGLKNQEWVRDMLLYGTGILGVEWRKGKPFIFNIPLRDFFVDPTSTGMVQTINPARYAGYEYLQDKEVLEREEIYDATEKKWVKRYKNLAKIGFDTSSNSGGEGNNGGMDKAFKDMFSGSTLGDKATERQVHIIKLHDLMTGRIYEVGNRKAFISDEPTWCQRAEITKKEMVFNPATQTEVEITRKLDKIDPFLPFAVLRDYIDSSQFYAEGEMALLYYDAELLNDYEAMQVDNNAYQNTPMYWIDPQFSDLAPEIETIPGAVYPIPRNAMGALERPQLSGDLDQKQERIMERMRRATAADEAVQGVGVTGRTTATEVSTQLAQAQMRFATKITNLENEGYSQLALIIFKLVQIFVTKKTAMRIVGKNGVFFKDFDPWEYNGEWEAHVQLDTTIKQKQMEVGQKDNQIYTIVSDDPQGIFNPVEVKRWMMQKVDPNLSDEEFNKLLAPPKEPQEDVKDVAVINYKDASAHTKAQMEAKAGYMPDPVHEAEAQRDLLEIAGRTVDILNPTTDTDNNMLPGVEQIVNPQPTEAPAGLSAAT